MLYQTKPDSRVGRIRSSYLSFASNLSNKMNYHMIVFHSSLPSRPIECSFRSRSHKSLWQEVACITLVAHLFNCSYRLLSERVSYCGAKVSSQLTFTFTCSSLFVCITHDPPPSSNHLLLRHQQLLHTISPSSQAQRPLCRRPPNHTPSRRLFSAQADQSINQRPARPAISRSRIREPHPSLHLSPLQHPHLHKHETTLIALPLVSHKRKSDMKASYN